MAFLKSVVWQLQSAGNHLGLMPPMRKMSVKKRSEFGMCPGGEVHAVGNGVDAVPGKHPFRRLGMAFGNAVDIIGQV